MNITELKDKLENYFKQEDYKYKYDEQSHKFVLGFRLACKIKKIEIVFRLAEKHLLVTGEVGIKADVKLLTPVAEYITRANDGLLFGNFDLDFDDGEVIYKLPVDLTGDYSINDEMIDRLIRIPYSMFEEYGDGLLSVIFGFESPKEAIDKVREKQSQFEEME